jgi:hypothetical protein
MAGFTFRLEHEDGTSADPPTFRTAVPNWQTGDAIPLGAGRAFRVVAIRDNDADQPPALVVEELPCGCGGRRTSTNELAATQARCYRKRDVSA